MRSRMSIWEEFKNILWIDNDFEFVVERLFFPKIDLVAFPIYLNIVFCLSLFYSVNLSVNHISVKVSALKPHQQEQQKASAPCFFDYFITCYCLCSQSRSFSSFHWIYMRQPNIDISIESSLSTSYCRWPCLLD